MSVGVKGFFVFEEKEWMGCLKRCSKQCCLQGVQWVKVAQTPIVGVNRDERVEVKM